MGKLSNEQLRFFEHNRFVLLPAFFPRDTVDRIKVYTDEIMDWQEDDGRWDIRFETSPDGQRQVSRIENFLPYHEGLNSILNNGKTIRAVIKELMGEEPILFKDKINVKPAHGKAFEYHQDRPAYGRFISSNITAMVSVDNTTPENGCLQFVCGYTSKVLLPHDQKGAIPTHISSLYQWHCCPTEPGDVVLFDGFAPHGSKPNQTDQARRAFFITYNPASEGDQNKYYYDYKRANPNAPELNLATPFDHK